MQKGHLNFPHQMLCQICSSLPVCMIRIHNGPPTKIWGVGFVERLFYIKENYLLITLLCDGTRDGSVTNSSGTFLIMPVYLKDCAAPPSKKCIHQLPFCPFSRGAAVRTDLPCPSLLPFSLEVHTRWSNMQSHWTPTSSLQHSHLHYGKYLMLWSDFCVD